MFLFSKYNIMNKAKKATDPKSHTDKRNGPTAKVNNDNSTRNKTSKGKPDKNVPSSPTTEVNPEG
jgi:hypothetical protein